MERESFSSPEVAAILNKHYIPVIVDRETRPDLNDVYMNFVTATTGSAGWPLSVFLTPELKPIFGGTYFPGSPRTGNRPRRDSQEEGPKSFIDILKQINDLWSIQRERCLQSAEETTQQLRAFAIEGTYPSNGQTRDQPEQLELDLLDEAFDHFRQFYDPVHGGFRHASAPSKFVTPTNLTFLLRMGAAVARPSTHTRFGFFSPVPGILGKTSCLKAAQMSLHTFRAMSRSALRDQLGYGFHRYSVTTDWNLPHFEKLTCDNAQLLGCYCDAWALGRDPEVLGTIYNLVEYFTNDQSPIVHKEGGWYSSEDSDSCATSLTMSNGAVSDHRKEGAFYVWTEKELQTVLGDGDARVLARHFGIKPDGNVPAKHDLHDEFLNQNVLFIAATPSVLAKEFGLSESDVVSKIKSSRTKLLDHRLQQRGRPQVDKKIVVSSNALAITALARAANTLATIDKIRAYRCKAAAERAAAFIRGNLYDEEIGRLHRVYFDSKSSGTAFSDDYAYLIQANLALYDLTLLQPYLDWAVKLQSYLDEHFLATETGGYFDCPRPAPGTGPEQIIRLKTGSDAALPSTNGTICTNLLYLSAYLQSHNKTSSDQAYTQKAKNLLNAFAVEILQYPFLYVTLLGALVMEQVGVKAIIAPMTTSDRSLNKLKGWGRTVVKGIVKEAMICTKDGERRTLQRDDLEDNDEFEEDAAVSKPAATHETRASVPAAA
jgi:uncharacterized protein YyaL (SSP411 family)